MPTAGVFAPLRHPTFRMLWMASLASNVGLWVQNTGAGWLMTSLAPSPLMVSLVQAATMLPVFLFALPAGALADILDRRLYLIAAQGWITLVALLLAALTATGGLGPWGLIALTFAIGVGQAANFPAWAATTPELVPREDLVGAIALNGIGFNLARAVGPALGGFVIAALGVAAAFALNAVTFLALIAALLAWRRPRPSAVLPKEHFLGAMRAGVRFVAASPPMHAAILRACAFFFFTAAVWALLPLVVRERLGLGPDAFGLMLAAMGLGSVATGFVLPRIGARLRERGRTVFAASLLSGAAVALLGLATHWVPAALAMVVFGAAWIGAASTLQTAAQLASPAWVRARAIGIYQLSFFGALALGSVLWGWVGSAFGLPLALGAAGVLGAAAAVAVRGWRLDPAPAAGGSDALAVPMPRPEDADAELARLLAAGRSGRVLEVVRYRIDPADRAAFLRAMAEVRRVRQRGGALLWRLYEDIAHPERWVELWAVESWTEHLREADRMTEEDRATLARAAALHRGDGPPEAARYLNVVPEEG
ncbi:MFS transporter [Caldovatus sediminis]|nr:MFS transporter [Caldovatus sediminis]